MGLVGEIKVFFLLLCEFVATKTEIEVIPYAVATSHKFHLAFSVRKLVCRFYFPDTVAAEECFGKAV